MGQKVSPIGFRLGINKDWESKWYANKKDYATWLLADIKIRKFIFKNFKNAGISKIEIERAKVSKDSERLNIKIHSSKPGMLIGVEGKEKEAMREKIWKHIRGVKNVPKNAKKDALDIKIDIIEIKNFHTDAQLVADFIALQLVNRVSFRIAQKNAITNAMNNLEVKGIKTLLSGRLGGVEMARTEGYSEGRVPLATIRSDIDFAKAEALTTYGLIGVKVWIYRGEIFSHKKSNKGGK